MIALCPMAVVPAPATPAETTLPAPGTSLAIVWAEKRKPIPRPPTTPKLLSHSATVFLPQVRPLKYANELTIMACRGPSNTMSENGIGVSPTVTETAVQA